LENSLLVHKKRRRSKAIPDSAETKTLDRSKAGSYRGGRTVLDRRAWIAEARAALVAGGIAAVKVGNLAPKLAVTRESFYHHFESLQELHDELLKDWDTGNEAVYGALLDSGHDSQREFEAMERMWLDEASYSPAWDAAIRDWARTSPRTARVLRRVDDRRVAIIKRMYMDAGYQEAESLVRARIYYFHQVGYYTVKPDESREERLRLFPIYARILKGLS
jgi:AcrR family transcriptional regulator